MSTVPGGHIQATERLPRAYFGADVDVDGRHLVVGSPRASYPDWARDVLTDEGAAYVFTRTEDGQWSQMQKIRASDGQYGERFGLSVAEAGDLIVVGSPNEDHGDIDAGAAYVFEFDAGTWREVAKLQAAEPSSGARFGHTLALTDDTLVVGAVPDGLTDWPAPSPFSNDPLTGSGASFRH